MKRRSHLDLNADVGEGFATDSALMPYLDSCSIACGGHAGDENSVRTTLQLAKAHGVKAGPHPSYPDPKHFGRRVLPIGRLELYQSIEKQLHAYLKQAKALDVAVHHVKLHGALYHQANENREMALLVWDCLSSCMDPTKIYLPPHSAMRDSLPDGWEVWTEAFIDRHYGPDLKLIPRSKPHAIIQSVGEMLDRFQDLSINQGIRTADGDFLGLRADTVCLHGDGPLAVKIAAAVDKHRNT